jgi:hypothetical protein
MLAVPVLLGAILAGAFSVAAADPAAKLEFTTISPNGRYSPNHVLAAWVTDAKTNFVKSISKYGNRRQRYLATWGQVRGAEAAVDGITGATLKTHEPLTVTWDGCDARKKPLPDGNYLLFVEFTDAHVQGPTLVVPVVKGPGAQTKTLPDQGKFKNIKLTCPPADK